MKIGVGDYECSTLSDLEQARQKDFNSIDITYRTSSPYTRVTFRAWKKYAYLECSDDTPLSQGIFSKIEHLLLARRRNWQWVETLFLISMGLGAVSSLFIIMGRVYETPALTIVGFAIVTLWLSSLLLYLATFPVRKSEITLAEEDERQTFWMRNRDTIIVAIISSIVSLLFGIIGTIIIQGLT
jgi:hypothetical protein